MAELEAERLKGNRTRYGIESAKLTAAQSEDAFKAFETLAKAGINELSLYALAAEEVRRHEQRKASKPIAEAWAEYYDWFCHEKKVTKKRLPTSPRSQSTKHYLAQPMLAHFTRTLVSDITKDATEKMLKKRYTTTTQRDTANRHLRPFFTWCIKRGYCQENPFEGIDIVGGSRGITIATPEQVRRCLMACKDWRQDKKLKAFERVDASDAAAGVAIAFFAGVRPQEELPGIDWTQVDLKKNRIRIKATTSKTRIGRWVRIEPNLREWLMQVPEHKRQGSVCGANWERKWKRIRKAAGFTKGDEDISRHSYATYHYAIHQDESKLRVHMGHRTQSILHDHYIETEIEEADAAAYWSITPSEPFKVIQSIA